MATYGSSIAKGTIILVSLVVLLIATIFFFTCHEFKSSGMFRSGKRSDATELYQLYPVQSNGKNYLISLEGVFKTNIYNRQGGIIQRSGNTDIRISVYDIESGEQKGRSVIGSYGDSKTKILGAGKDVLWLYNHKEGLHSVSIPDLETKTKQENIIQANTSLSGGLAEADQYMNNVNELYGYNAAADALMVTTVSGAKVWINAATFQNTDAAILPVAANDDMDRIMKSIEEAAEQGNIPQDQITEMVNMVMRQATSEMGFSEMKNLSDRVTGPDSCTYAFEGSTVRTLTQSACPQPKTVENKTGKKGSYIEPEFLSSYDAKNKQYVNPPFLGSDNVIIFHAASMGSKTNLLMSMLTTRDLQPAWTCKTNIPLGNYKASYSVNAEFAQGDSLFLAVNNHFLCVNVKTGNLIWKTDIGNGDYEDRIYFIGNATQNGKNYFIAANSNFTILHSDGIFITGRTDNHLSVIDAVTGKTIKQIQEDESAPENLPYYLGMIDGTCWFYTKNEGIHTRSLPDLKVTGTSFKTLLDKAGIKSSLVATSNYDDAVEEKYIAMDALHKAVYFTTEDGSHYRYNLATSVISGVMAPSDEYYEKWMHENPSVDFYRVSLQHMYAHEIFLPGGASLSFDRGPSTATIEKKENKPVSENAAVSLSGNQFIKGEILTNAIPIAGQMLVTEHYETPLIVDKNDHSFYIRHKDKIASDAHTIISKYDINSQTVLWKFDVTQIVPAEADVERIYTLGNTIYLILKTHPDLDDNFTCIALDASTGNSPWHFQF